MFHVPVVALLMGAKLAKEWLDRRPAAAVPSRATIRYEWAHVPFRLAEAYARAHPEMMPLVNFRDALVNHSAEGRRVWAELEDDMIRLDRLFCDETIFIRLM